MQIPPLLMKKIKEIHILTVGGVPGISNFKSHASRPCSKCHVFEGFFTSFFGSCQFVCIYSMLLCLLCAQFGDPLSEI